MKSKTLIILVIAAGAVGGAAAILSQKGRAVTRSEETTGLMFPELPDKVNDVALLTVKKGDKEVSFKRTATGWESPDKGGYPAKIEKIKEIAVGLSQLRVIEPKTSKPENYAKIGVEDPVKPAAPATPPSPTDPPAPQSNATLITLKDDKDQTITSVIVGNTKWEGKGSTYIRKAGDAQSWLVEGRLELPYDFSGWVDNNIASIPRDRIKEAELIQADGTRLRITRAKKEDKDFTVVDLPAGEELTSPSAPDAVANAISSLTLEDVSLADQIDFAGAKGGTQGTPLSHAEFSTFDGMKITVLTADKDGKTWAHFVAAFDEAAAAPATPEAKPEEKPGEPRPAADKKPDEVQKEVVDFNNKLAKYAFALPPYKASAFKTKMQDLLKSKPPAPPASLNQGNQAAPLNAPLPPVNLPVTPPPPEPKPESPVKPPQDPAPAPAPTGG